MKKVLFVKSPCQLWNDLAVDLYSAYNWEPAIYLGARAASSYSENIKNTFPEVSFISHRDALCGRLPDGLVLNDLVGIDASLIKGYAGVFSRLYEVGRRYLSLPVLHDNYYAYCYRLLRIYITLARSRAFDLVISNSVPHRFYDNILYEVCKREGIPFLGVEVSNGFPGLHTVSAEFEDRAKPIRDLFQRKVIVPTLPDNIQQVLDRGKGEYQHATPQHFQRAEMRLRTEGRKQRVWAAAGPELRFLWRLLKNFSRGQLFSEGDRVKLTSEIRWREAGFENRLCSALRQYKADRQAHDARLWYFKHCEQPNLSTPFIYYSANRQPERSTAPDAGRFADLGLLCEILSAAAPSQWNIYYKEHPSNFRQGDIESAQRSIDYYKRIQKIAPRIKFIPHDYEPFKLIDNAKVVATATGTVAWEAALRGTPSIIAGDFWLRHLPGVFYVDSVHSCCEAFRRVEQGEMPTSDDIKRYIGALFEHGIHNSLHRGKNIEQIKQKNPEEYRRGLEKISSAMYREYLRIEEQYSC